MNLSCRRAGAAALVLAAVLAGCVQPPPADETAAYTPGPAPARAAAYVVQPGDTIYSIASAHGVDFRAMLDANPNVQNIRDLQPGQVIMVPGVRTAPVTPPVRPTVKTPLPARNPGHPGPIAAEAHFIWPIRGQVVSRFREAGSGVELRATPGQAVVAAKSGRVNLFANAPEFGQVIVLEHQDGSATYYGHLGAVLVPHGVWVKQGEVIASAGASARNGAELHFRVMENDRFVDPLPLLTR